MAEALTLYLDNLHDLFNAPAFDPFSPHPRNISGIDSIIQQLQPSMHDNQPFVVRICLPAAQVTPELQAQIRAAVKQFAEQKINEMDHELVVLRWRARKGLQSGLGILGLFLLLAAVVGRATFLAPWLSTLLGEALTIIGSVSLWHPAEMFIFDWVPFARQKRIYHFISTLDFEIRAG